MHVENLHGKVISITIKDDSVSHDFINPEFKELQGRTFVTGITPKGQTDSGWTDNCPAGVAWDRVTDYVIFDSIESYIYAVKKSEIYEEQKEKED